jgi:aspartokinase
MPKIEVYKFGGVAVGSADAIRTAAAHVKRAAPGVAVVVSAMNGVTDMLLAAANAALRRDRDACERAALEFEKRHTDVIEELLRSPKALLDELAASAHELRSMCESIAVLRELTPRAQDTLVARGEQLNARIFVALLNEQSIDAAYVDAVDIITTERRLGSLWPHLEECEAAPTSPPRSWRARSARAPSRCGRKSTA